MKKILAFVLAAVTAFYAAFVFPAGGAALTAYAAKKVSGSAVKKASERVMEMLPYYYEQLTKEEKEYYIKIRTAVMEQKSSLPIHLREDKLIKILCIMCTSDVLVGFNMDYKYVQWSRNISTKYSDEVRFKYKYSPEAYNEIINYADECAENVLKNFTAKTSDYKKIKFFHDYIIENCEYRLEGEHLDNIYGALGAGTAKCDGYAHAFNYLCIKAGIPSVTVISRPDKDGVSHAWNKVKCGQKWYNIDLTWDDPVSQLKENSFYAYFMISDEQTALTHDELSSLGFEYPEADDDRLNYYIRNNLVAHSERELRTLLSSEIAKAAENGSYKVNICLADDADYSSFGKPDLMYRILSAADSNTEQALITKGCFCRQEDYGIVTVQFFRKNTKVSDYFNAPEIMSADTLKFLKSLGLKIA